MRAYVDTSAAAKLLQRESESAQMQRFANREDVELVSTLLLETELRRFASRSMISQTAVSDVLEGVSLFGFEESDFKAAGLLPGETLRSLDALHIQGAIALGADCMVAYDTRLADACAGDGR
ncbi:MAG: type II toxin-antitoxin system VapC family toxin [Propionibacteriaceae bacterium]|nr:type II toxin-antitoxin system VapC family toxin [Propionibacteriaceae bacterium]